MIKLSDFDKFLKNIEPSKSTIEYISSVHTNLRKFLVDELNDVVTNTYLSGSYAKHTNIRPKLHDGKRDVDIVVETTYSDKDDSVEVLKKIHETLSSSDKYKATILHSHSIGVELQGIDIDVVPVARSSNGTNYIGSSKTNQWTETDPKGHIEWVSKVNKEHNGKFVPIVKAFKWWKRLHFGGGHDYPKGIALEVMISENLPCITASIEEYFVATMANMAERYSFVNEPLYLKDPCVPNNNLLNKTELSKFQKFVSKMKEHAKLISQDSSNSTWQKVLGPEFPSEENLEKTTSRRGPDEEFIEEKMKVCEQYTATIHCQVTQNGFRSFMLASNCYPLRHGASLDFNVKTNTPPPYKTYWKVRNVGEEAEKRRQVRGQIFYTTGQNHHESTLFFGPHYVECYIVKDNICVARGRIEVPIGHN